MEDLQILNGLLQNGHQKPLFEKALYLKYKYYIDEGCRKYRLNNDDSSSAYNDSVLSAIKNVTNGSFKSESSLKTYLFQIFSNKCIDLVRKNTTNKNIMHHNVSDPELLSQLPDASRNVVDKLINRQQVQTIKQYLEVIGEKCKEILLLFEEGFTDSQIAEKMSYNNAAVAKTTRLRCLEKIKEKVKSVFN